MITQLTAEVDGSIKIDSLNLNSINILTGKNGTGKSLTNKLIWLCTIVGAVKQNGDSSLDDEEYFKTVVRDVIRKTLFDSENIDLKTTATFEDGYITIHYNNDDLKFLDYKLPTKQIPHPRYLSTNTRLFSGVQSTYNSMREDYTRLEEVGIPLYDFTFAYEFVMKYKKEDYIEFEEEHVKMFKDHYDLDVIGMIYKNGFFYVKDSKGKEKKAMILSNGQQALLCMICSQL